MSACGWGLCPTNKSVAADCTAERSLRLPRIRAAVSSAFHSPAAQTHEGRTLAEGRDGGLQQLWSNPRTRKLHHVDPAIQHVPKHGIYIQGVALDLQARAGAG